MKKLFLIPILFFLSCASNSNEIPSQDSIAALQKEALQKQGAANPNYIHWELLSAKGEVRLGDSPFVFILHSTYQTDKTDSVCFANLEHGAHVMNAWYANQHADTDRIHYPFVAYDYQTGFGGTNRRDGWCYISMRGMTDTAGIKSWMKNVSTSWNRQLKIDSTKNPATIYKIAGKTSVW